MAGLGGRVAIFASVEFGDFGAHRAGGVSENPDLIPEADGARADEDFRDAEARERAAQAEATATQMVSDAIAKGDIAALNYFVAEKYVRAIDSLAKSPNQKTFIMPMDMAGIAGTLGGIAELARSSLGESRRADENRAPARSVPSTGVPRP